MVIYGSMTNLSIGALFLAGILPGLVIGLVLMLLVAFYSVRRNYPHRPRLSWTARLRSVWVAIPALGAPVIIIGGIVSGFYTPTEAGVIASVYGLFVWPGRVPGVSLEGPARGSGGRGRAYRRTGFRARHRGRFRMAVDRARIRRLGRRGVAGRPGLSSTAMLMLIVAMLLVIGLVLEGMAALIIFRAGPHASGAGVRL